MKSKITADWKDFSATDYLNQYYKTTNIPDDERAIFNFLFEFFRKVNENFEIALDVGVGPTLHHDIAIVPYVKELHVSDYLSQNLKEVKKWLQKDPSAHNWDIYVKGILQMEGTSSVSKKEVTRRKRQMRNKISQVKIVDLSKINPLGKKVQYPLVTSFYCADSATRTKKQWLHYMKNLTSLVEPSGWIVLSALRNAQSYQVGPRFFPSANIDEHDMKKMLILLGFSQKTLDIKVEHVPEWSEEGFDSIIIASGQKK